MRALTIHEKLALVERISHGGGPTAVVAQATVVQLSAEFDRHIQNVAWIIDTFDDAFAQMVREVGEPLIEETIKNLPPGVGRV